MPVMNGYEATAVCDCFGFYNRADRSASYPDCNGTYSHSALVGNPVYLGRILSNIMDNAIKFSQAGSVLTVGVKEETLDDDRANFTFYCKDQGLGMSEDFIAHAFDMFAQESETSRSRYEGTGLGLAITKQLVDRMDGSIEKRDTAFSLL